MKLKLIQSGGFMGRSKFAEEDLSCHSGELQESLDKHFSEFKMRPITNDPPVQRDSTQYFVEYNGTRLPIDEEIKLKPELAEVLEKLKANLHY
jgi:hypothetical protein